MPTVTCLPGCTDSHAGAIDCTVPLADVATLDGASLRLSAGRYDDTGTEPDPERTDYLLLHLPGAGGVQVDAGQLAALAGAVEAARGLLYA